MHPRAHPGEPGVAGAVPKGHAAQWDSNLLHFRQDPQRGQGTLRLRREDRGGGCTHAVDLATSTSHVPFAPRRRTVCGVTPTVESPAALAELLDQQGYLPDEGIVTAMTLVERMGKR